MTDRVKYRALSFMFISSVRLTDCVTCAGAGTAKPSSQKKDKACETVWDVRRIPSVRCTLCWARVIVQGLLAEKKYRCQLTEFYTYLNFLQWLKTQEEIFILE